MKKIKTTPSDPTVPGTPATPTDDVEFELWDGSAGATQVPTGAAYESDYDIVIELGLGSAIDEIKFTGSDGDAGKFNIAKVGPLGSCK